VWTLVGLDGFDLDRQLHVLVEFRAAVADAEVGAAEFGHRIGAAPFALNTPVSAGSYNYKITRLEYYISEIKIIHDGGYRGFVPIETLAMGRKDYDQAEQEYRKVIAAEPRHAVALNNLAWVLNRAGKPDALETAEKALALAPNATAFMDTLAEIQASSGQWDKALATQKRAIELDPDKPTHRLHLAQYLIKNSQKASAKAELQRLAQLGGAFPRQDEVQKLMSGL